MAITIQTPIGPVVAQEIVAGYEESVTLQYGPQARKGFLVPWASRFWTTIGLLGFSKTTSIGGTITLNTPLPHPELTHTYAHTVEIQGVGAPIQGSTQIAYDKCILWVNYQTLPWSYSPFSQINPNQPIVFAEQRIASSCEWIAIPGNQCKWVSTGTTGYEGQEPPDVRIRTAIIDIEVSLKNFPYMPSPAALTQAGTLNEQRFFGVEPGSLMFMGVETRQGSDASGNLIQSEVNYKFVARSLRWDADWHDGIGAFDIHAYRAGYVSATQYIPLIPLTDFTLIFPFPYTNPNEWPT